MSARVHDFFFDGEKKNIRRVRAVNMTAIVVGMHWNDWFQSGKPAHEGGPPQEGSFHFASRFTGERTISAKNYNEWCLCHEGSCILSPSTNL